LGPSSSGPGPSSATGLHLPPCEISLGRAARAEATDKVSGNSLRRPAGLGEEADLCSRPTQLSRALLKVRRRLAVRCKVGRSSGKPQEFGQGDNAVDHMIGKGRQILPCAGSRQNADI